ncbi:MAG TPA: hypothetical protein VFT49_01005 [Candidatus Saccharimonadales bacterium]|nr:hypothetical protein [Candidatus Saccharimonadales bacterium]
MSWDKARPIIHRLADGLRATGFDDEQPTHPKRIFWQGEAGGMHPDDIPKLKSRYEESLSANA